MSIEKDPFDSPVPEPSVHKDALRKQLLAHFPGSSKSSKRLFWPIALATPIAALGVFAIFALWPMNSAQDTINVKNDTSRILSTLTPKQVLAIAEKKTDELKSLPDGSYYYEKSYNMNIEVGNPCLQSFFYQTLYQNNKAVRVWTETYGANHQLMESYGLTEDGSEQLPKYVYNYPAKLANQKPVTCPDYGSFFDLPTGEVTDQDRKTSEQLAEIATKLYSLDPVDRKEGLKMLAQSDQFAAIRNQKIEGYDGSVMVMKSKGLAIGFRVWQYFFDEKNQNFIGFESPLDRVIITERGVSKTHPGL